MRAIKVSGGAACVGAMALLAGAAHAQAANPFSSTDPANALPAPAASSAPLQAPAIQGGPTPDDQADQGQFILEAVVFDGATALSAAALEPAWGSYRGRSVGLSDLRRMAQAGEDLYDKAGYPFVAIIVPPQAVAGGRIRLQVIEAKVSDLTVLGLDPVGRRQVAAAFDPLVGRAPLSSQDIQRAYNNAQAIPGLSVAGALRAGSQPGGMDLVVQARRRTWRGYVNVNNVYSDPVGPWGALAGAEYYGASTYGDRTAVQLYSALDRDEQRVVRLAHYRGLNASGLSLNADILVARANPRGALSTLDLATDVTTAHVEIGQLLYARAGLSATGTLSLEATNQKTRVFRSIDLTEDRLRILSARVSGDWSRPRMGGSYALEVRQGLSLGDSSRRGDPLLSRDAANPHATVFRGTFQGEALLPARFVGALTLQGQATNASLAAPEEFSVGNLTVGRGYEPGASFGDSAAAISAELRTPVFAVRPGLTLQPFVFVDGVRVWNKEAGAPDRRWIASSGPGVRMVLLDRAQLALTYAVPATRPLGLGEPKPTPTLLFNLTIGVPDAFRGFGRLMSRSPRQ